MKTKEGLELEKTTEKDNGVVARHALEAHHQQDLGASERERRGRE